MAQRRPRGSGSIYYEPAHDRYAITFTTADGKYNKRRIRGSRIDAERELRAELAKADAGAPKVDRRMTVDAWLTTWLDSYVAGKSIGTRRRYRDISDRLIRPSLGRIKLSDLSDTDVARLKAKLVRDGHSRRGADAVLDVLSAALGQAVRSRIVAANVRTRVPRELSAVQPRHVPTREETDRMLAAVADQPRWFALYALTIGHGLRQSETLGLQWGDRSADGRDVTIRRKAEYQTRRLDEEPKDSSVRTIRLLPWVADALDALGPGRGDQLVFATRSGLPLHGRNLLKHVHALSIRLGLQYRYDWHSLRHAMATRAHAAGTSLDTLRATLGHRDIKTTLIYLRPGDVIDDLQAPRVRSDRPEGHGALPYRRPEPFDPEGAYPKALTSGLTTS